LEEEEAQALRAMKKQNVKSDPDMEEPEYSPIQGRRRLMPHIDEDMEDQSKEAAGESDDGLF
jgi:hypothetical protein